MSGSAFYRSPLSRRSVLLGGLGLGAAAALGLAGCSNEGRGGVAAAGSTAVALPTYIPFHGIPVDLKGKDGVSDTMLAYPASPKKVTDGKPGDGEDISVLALTNTPVPPGVDKNAYWQELNKRLGFAMGVSLVPSGDFTDRFQTMVAGDRLPDVFSYFPGQVPGLPGLLSEKAADLTELLSGDAVSKYPFLANIPTTSWGSTVYGGKIYGIPIPRGAIQSTVLYGRGDLLEREGISADTANWDEFYDLCSEISSQSARRWALGRLPLGTIRQMFGIPNGWSEQGGKLTSANEHERQQEALEAGRKLMAGKFVHPDGVSASQPQRKTWLVNETVSLLDDTFSAWPDFSNYPIDDKFRLEVVQAPMADGGGSAPMWLGPPAQNITSISAAAADRAEAILEVLNYLAAPFGSEEHLFKNYGIEGVHHELKGTDPVLTEKGRIEIQLSMKYVGEGPWVNFMAGKPEVARAQYDAQTQVVPTAVANPVEGLFSDTGSRRGGQIGEPLGAVETDILEGRKPVSAWGEAVKTWKAKGGDKIRDEYEKALAEREG